MSYLMQNKDTIPSVVLNERPMQNRRCVAWDDDTNYLVSGVYRGQINGKHLVETDYDTHDWFKYDHAVRLIGE